MQRDTDGDTPSSTIALLPKYMLSRDTAHSFSGFYSKTKIMSACKDRFNEPFLILNKYHLITVC